jgi:DNA polymerase-1
VQSCLPEWVTNPNPDIYLSDNFITLDFETTNIEFGTAINPKNSLVCGAWSYGGETKVLFGNEYKFQELLDDIAKADFLVGANIKFDLQWLHRCGLDLTKIIVYDTQIGEYVFQGNRSANLDLDSVASRYGFGGKSGLVSKLIKLGVCPSTMPESWLREYNIRDIRLTEQVFLKQRKILKDLGLLPTQYTRCLLTPVLADIERHGMIVDEERVKKIHGKLSIEYNQVIGDMNKLTGGINPRSGKQVGEYLYDTLKFEEIKRRGKPMRTPAGNRLTDSDTILALVPKTPEQEQFLTLKKRQSYLEAKLSKSFQKFYDCLNDPDEPGVLRFKFNQTVTQNHRLSSSGTKYKIQGQNIDREVKPIFKARRKGWKVGELDQAQLEFRAGAFLGQDERAMQSIIDKEDVHKFTATQLCMVDLEDVTDEMRQDAKPETFKPLYGGEYGTPEQMAYYKAFRAKYPELSATQEDWTYEVLRTGKLKTITGLIFYWPGTKMNSRGQIDNKRNIYNYPISSLATADIVPIGVVCLWHRMASSGIESFLNNTIHDSAIAEIAPGEEQVFEELGKQAFIDDTYKYLKDCYDIDWNVPLEVETVIGDFWKDKKSWVEKWIA